MAKKKYIVEFSIDDSWIEDGFDIRTKLDVYNIIQNYLPYANRNEVGGRVIHAPSLKVIKKLQGVK
jgi:hypothetical protein